MNNSKIVFVIFLLFYLIRNLIKFKRWRVTIVLLWSIIQKLMVFEDFHFNTHIITLKRRDVPQDIWNSTSLCLCLHSISNCKGSPILMKNSRIDT